MAVVSLLTHRRNRYGHWQGASLDRLPYSPSLSAVPSRSGPIDPPSLFTRSTPSWQRRMRSLLARLFGRSSSLSVQPLVYLRHVRSDFEDMLDDMDSPSTDQLREHIAKARSLRELWHLRLNVFDLVSLHHGQATALERLKRLNQHFPARVQRANQGKGRTVAW